MEQKISRNSFWKFGTSRNFLFHLAFLLGMKQHQFQSQKSYKMAVSLSSWHYIGCKMICHSLSLFLIAYSPQKRLGSDFLKNCGLVLLNFLWVSSPGLHTLPQVKFVSFSHHTWLGQSGKYQEKVEFWMWDKILYMKQLTALETATSSRSFSILSSNSWWEMCSSVIRMRLVWLAGLVKNTVPFDIQKFWKFKPEFLVKWHAPLMVSALDSGASTLGSSPGWGHCVLFLGKMLYQVSVALSDWEYFYSPLDGIAKQKERDISLILKHVATSSNGRPTWKLHSMLQN